MTRKQLTPTVAGTLAVIGLAIFAIAIGGALSERALGDTVLLNNGKSLEGKILFATDPVRIELVSGGVVEIPLSQVKKLEYGPTTRDVLKQREAALKAGDVAALCSLADWCRDNNLAAEQTRLSWRILELDPDHATTRQALGFRKLGAIWLTEADYQTALGRIFYDGSWLSPEQFEIAEARDRTQEQIARSRELLKVAASGTASDDKRAQALKEFQEIRPSLRTWTLLKATESLQARERQFAVRQLGTQNDRRYAKRLSHLAVTDSKRSVRDEALAVLKEWQDPDTSLSFVPYLSSGDDRFRVNAANALSVLPDRRAVGTLIRTAHYIWAGFGRSHIASVVQRAYVKDYELVSGGTGLVVQEVADPVIDTFMEGIVLDIDIRKAEAFARIGALERATGQKFGTDFDRWASWWSEETGRPVAGLEPDDAALPASPKGATEGAASEG
ncbi:MAG: hypothetical protein ACKVX7_11910 [Planctomycetota bacterium]